MMRFSHWQGTCVPGLLPAMLGLAVIPSPSHAEIPVYGQSSLSREAAIETPLPAGGLMAGRYGFEGLEYRHFWDPADDSKRVVRLEEETLKGLFFEAGSEPSTLILEWEQYHEQVDGSNCVFFGLLDVENQPLTLQRLPTDTAFSNVPGLSATSWTESMPLDEWVRLRLEITARSGGPGSNDGTLVMKMETDAGLVTVADITGHDMTNIAQIGLFLTDGTTLRRLAAWRRLVWDGSGQDVYDAATNSDSLYRDIGHQLGVMEPDGLGGVRMTVWVNYDLWLYGHPMNETGADVELDTDPAFTAPLTASITLTEADAYNGVATVEGLLPNTTYFVRAHLKRDGAVVATTFPTSFRTISVPDGAPGKLHVIHGACARSNEVVTPNSTFRSALLGAPDDATLIFSHLGDLQYIDQMLGYQNAPPGQGNHNASDELFDRAYDHMFFSAEFQELSSNASCWFMWDDHEVENGRTGVDAGGEHAPDPLLFDMALNAAHRWWGNRLLDGTSLDRYYYHVETAECLFIYLDVRTHGDQVTTLIGDTQKTWLLDLLEAKPKALVFLNSQTTWSSGAEPLPKVRRAESWHDHTVERDEIINAFLVSNPTGHLFLLSGDTHIGMHNTSEFQAFGPRVHGDWMVGAYGTGLHPTDETEWEPGGMFEADHIEYYGVEPESFMPVQGYATIDIDETELSVRIALVHGVTGEETYAVQELCAPSPDLDCDGTVGAADLLLLLAAWGTDPGGPPDFDGDGDVDIIDLLALLAGWNGAPLPR